MKAVDARRDISSKKKRSVKASKKEAVKEVEKDNSDQSDTEAENVEEELNDEDEVLAHQRALDNLQSQDPEFFKFLQANDKGLLDFAQDDDDEDILSNGDEDENEAVDDGEVSDGQEDDIADPDDMEDVKSSEKVITLMTVKNWTREMTTNHSMTATRKFISALHSVAVLNGDNGPSENQSQYRIDDSEVFGKLILGAVQSVPAALNFHFAITADSFTSGKTKLPSSSAKWQKNRAMLKSWLLSIMTILDQLADITMLDYVLRELLGNGVVVYYACFGQNSLGRKFVKKLIDIWSSQSMYAVGSSEIDAVKKLRGLKLSALILVRQLAVHSPSTYLDICLKTAYRSFLSVCINTNASTLDNLKFLSWSLIELFKLDAEQAYHHAFMYIRQLAIRLRNSITQMSKETYQALYNWQVLHAIRFWSSCLAVTGNHYGKAGQMNELVYPLAMVAFGIIRHANGSHFYPLQLHILQALSELSRNAKVYIPITGPLLQLCIKLHDLPKQKSSSLKPLDWPINLKAPASYVGTQVYVDDVIERSLNLMAENMAIWSTHVAFAEMAVTPISLLRKMSKKSKNPKFVKQAKTIIAKLEETREALIARRSGVDFAPSDIEKALEFSKALNCAETPIGAYAAVLSK